MNDVCTSDDMSFLKLIALVANKDGAKVIVATHDTIVAEAPESKLRITLTICGGSGFVPRKVNNGENDGPGSPFSAANEVEGLTQDCRGLFY